jgi:hypothetical protein
MWKMIEVALALRCCNLIQRQRHDLVGRKIAVIRLVMVYISSFLLDVLIEWFLPEMTG